MNLHILHHFSSCQSQYSRCAPFFLTPVHLDRSKGKALVVDFFLTKFLQANEPSHDLLVLSTGPWDDSEGPGPGGNNAFNIQKHVGKPWFPGDSFFV